MTRIAWSEMDDDALVKRGEQQLWLSAFANNNPRAPAHAEADALYDECQARGKPYLYQRAYNRSWASCGFEVTDDMRAKATTPQAAEVSQ